MDVTQPIKPHRRRRWWVYGLWGVGTIFVLIAVFLVSAALYFNHLVKTYTSPTPVELPEVAATDDSFQALQERWEQYALQFLKAGTEESFELSAEELNDLAVHKGPFKKRAFVEVLQDEFRVKFSVPLDQTGNEGLRGRFLNGEATFKPEYKDGHIATRLKTLRANGKAIPNWILRRLQRQNWVSPLNWRPEFDMVIRHLDRVEVEPGRIVLYPKPMGR